MSCDADRIREVFLAVMDLRGLEREDALRLQCGSDASLRAEVESLLKHDRGDPPEAGDRPSPGECRRRTGEMVGVYRLERLLGSGGFGEVWAGRQIEPLERVVAVKFLSGGTGDRYIRERFDLERRILARLGHPGIARIIEADSLEDGTPWFAMDYIQGDPLIDAVRDRELDLVTAVELLIEVCDAIVDAHRVGVIHLDLKSSNIIVSDAEEDRLRPIVIDFGIARLRAGESGPSLATIAGTPGTMAPEQFEGAEDIDTRADVWALGGLLQSLVKVCVPVGGRRSKEIGWIAERASARQRENRYQSVDALRGELRRWRNGEPLLESGPSGVRRRFETLLRLHPRLVTTVLVAFILLLAALGLTILEQRRTERALARAEANRALVQSFLEQFDRIDAGSLEKIRYQRLLAEAVNRIDSNKDADPLLEAEMRQAIATFAFAGGDSEIMADQLSQVVDILGAELGLESGDSRLRRARSQLAKARYNQGRFPEAERLARDLLREGDDDDVSLRLLLASTIIAQNGRENDALELLDDLDARLPVGSPQRGSVDFSMGRALVGLGRTEEAIDRIERSIDVLLVRLDPDDPAVLWRRIHLGEALLLADRLESATRELEEVFDRQRAMVGDDHVNTHWMRERLGDLRLAQGRRREALESYRRSLEGRLRWIQPSHPDIADLRTKIEALELEGETRVR